MRIGQQQHEIEKPSNNLQLKNQEKNKEKTKSYINAT